MASPRNCANTDLMVKAKRVALGFGIMLAGLSLWVVVFYLPYASRKLFVHRCTEFSHFFPGGVSLEIDLPCWLLHVFQFFEEGKPPKVFSLFCFQFFSLLFSLFSGETMNLPKLLLGFGLNAGALLRS